MLPVRRAAIERKPCVVDGCGKPSHNRHRYCAMHLRRWHRHGDINANLREKTYPWVLAHTEYKLDDCLIWPYRLNAYGYPLGTKGRKAFLGHRLMCELAHGPAPSAGLHAAHACGVAACMNPKHLRWATPSENIADREAHGTTARGERGGTAKLTNEQAAECKALLASGVKGAEIARRFGVSTHAISKIKTGRNWGWLNA